ncbi:MAG: DUF3536 domain-containing protein [candidate division NC10 bacterium]|nr:DUF3536 domain-containing protein [candidate division NC10 bacterium]
MNPKKPIQHRRLLVVHGHFYQPPRENPWTGRVDRQSSAFPFHDWNERIHAQCYAPNAFSRILTGSGEIERLVNNYEHFSFNVGPTLLAWLDEHHPETVRGIVTADAASCARLEGCGNAMAQAHGHIILPLADDFDLKTQLRWGRADFEHRFGRAPAGIWLPETAIDARTADAVMDAGFTFVMLSPHQARRIRPLAGGAWTDVAGGALAPWRPCFLRRHHGDDRESGLLVLFYNDELSRSVAFEGLLKSADKFSHRVQASFAHAPSEDAAVIVSTDGESYGHHEPFGDMCLAALTRLKLPEAGIAVVNAEWVVRHLQPKFEVELKPGDDGLGTAWSCAHGLGRWTRDCGCHSGSGPGWNQRWRTPLREGLEELSRDLKRAYYSFACRYFRDPWAARDRYIQVILESHSAPARERFLGEELKKEASESTRRELLLLLESQRHAMAMFTSCGWFFDDISGLEPVQNLRYAARAIELAGDHSKAKLHDQLRSHLRRAVSNIPENRDGEHIYTSMVLPGMLDPRRAAARALLLRAAGARGLNARSMTDELDAGSISPDCERPARGVVTTTEQLTGHKRRFRYRTNRVDPVGLLVRIGTESDRGDLRGQEPVAWSDFDQDLKESLANGLLRTAVNDLDAISHRIFREAAPILGRLRDLGLPFPPALRTAARRSLEADLEEIEGQVAQEWDPASCSTGLGTTSGRSPTAVDPESPLVRLRRVFALAERFGLSAAGPDDRPLRVPIGLARALSGRLCSCIEWIALGLSALPEKPHPFVAAIQQASAILDLEKEFGIGLHRFDAENRMYELIVSDVQPWLDRSSGGTRPLPAATGQHARQLIELAARLNFSKAVVARLVERVDAPAASAAPAALP